MKYSKVDNLSHQKLDEGCLVKKDKKNKGSLLGSLSNDELKNHIRNRSKFSLGIFVEDTCCWKSFYNDISVTANDDVGYQLYGQRKQNKKMESFNSVRNRNIKKPLLIKKHFNELEDAILSFHDKMIELNVRSYERLLEELKGLFDVYLEDAFRDKKSFLESKSSKIYQSIKNNKAIARVVKSPNFDIEWYTPSHIYYDNVAKRIFGNSITVCIEDWQKSIEGLIDTFVDELCQLVIDSSYKNKYYQVKNHYLEVLKSSNIYCEEEDMYGKCGWKDKAYPKLSRGRMIKKHLSLNPYSYVDDYFDALTLVYAHEAIFKYVNLHFSKGKKSEKKTFDNKLDPNIIVRFVKNQMKNTLVSHMITGGKLRYYFKDASDTLITSDVLTKLKINDSFVRSLFNAFGSATYRLMSAVNSSTTSLVGREDILAGSKLESILKNIERIRYIDIINQLISNESVKGLLVEPNENKSFIRYLRTVIYKVRNNSVHFVSLSNYKVLFNDIHDPADKENKNKPVQLIKKLYDIYISKEAVYQNWQLRLDSLEIIKHVPNNVVTEVLSSLKLNGSSFGYQFIPSFKKMFNRGTSLQKNYRELRLYLKCDNNEKDNAVYFLIKQIYNYNFKDFIFKSNGEYLRKFVVKEINRNNNQNRMTGYSKYHNLPMFEKNMLLEDYLSLLQSAMFCDISDNNKYIKFIRNVYAFAFNDYIKTYYNCLINVPNVMGLQEKLNIRDVLNSDFDVPDNTTSNQNFLLFCLLQDSMVLGEFRNELIKFKLSQSDNKNLKDFNQMISIIDLVISKQDNVNINSIDPKKLKNKFDDYKYDVFEEPNNETIKNVYYQNNNLVLYKPLVNFLDKYHGTLMKDFLNGNKNLMISTDELELYQTNQSNVKMIENQHAKREEIHKKYTRTKLFDNEIADYKDCCSNITSFVNNKNRVLFHEFNQANRLIRDIHFRLSGYIQMCERDMIFLNIYDEIVKHNYSNQWDDKYVNGAIRKKRSDIVNKALDYNKKLRDQVAHNAYFTNDITKSVLTLLSQVRALLNYDRKLKNSVTKSFIDILDKHGIKIILKIEHTHDGEKITIKHIESKKIMHLKKSSHRFETDIHSKKYIDLVKAWLLYERK